MPRVLYYVFHVFPLCHYCLNCFLRLLRTKLLLSTFTVYYRYVTVAVRLTGYATFYWRISIYVCARHMEHNMEEFTTPQFAGYIRTVTIDKSIFHEKKKKQYMIVEFSYTLLLCSVGNKTPVIDICDYN